MNLAVKNSVLIFISIVIGGVLFVYSLGAVWFAKDEIINVFVMIAWKMGLFSTLYSLAVNLFFERMWWKAPLTLAAGTLSFAVMCVGAVFTPEGVKPFLFWSSFGFVILLSGFMGSGLAALTRKFRK